ncbi:MAG: nucleoside triphosphate pyrophosphatase [Synechococcus sp.]|nr:nucleoside triphosphate pyrophosphatase [Synechococcus sp.]
MLLLASASPARRRLLEQAGLPHRVQVSGVEEEAFVHPDPCQLVQRLAQAKARVVAALGSPAGEGDAGACTAVLGCDSLLSFEGEAYGKPADAEEACRRWSRMAGRWAELHTGHCLIPLADDRQRDPALAEKLTTVTTRVQFASLSEAEIRAYVATGEPLQCAGGFALEGRGGLLVERLEGCWSNVIGLSLPLLRRWLEEQG